MTVPLFVILMDGRIVIKNSFCIGSLHSDLIFVKRFTRPDFLTKKNHTLEVRTFRLVLLEKNQRKCINLVVFLLEFN